MADLKKVYMDSDCFIDLAKQAIGVLPSTRTQDVWFTWQLLQAHKDKTVIVLASTISIAECTHADGNSDEKVRSLLTRLFMSGQFLSLVQPTPFIAVDARDLRWRHGLSIRGADSLHVASAMFLKADEFLTTDGKITTNKAALEGLGLRVTNPAKTVCLPTQYRQEELLNDKVTILHPKTGEGPA